MEHVRLRVLKNTAKTNIQKCEIEPDVVMVSKHPRDPSSTGRRFRSGVSSGENGGGGGGWVFVEASYAAC